VEEASTGASLLVMRNLVALNSAIPFFNQTLLGPLKPQVG
jgi:hypothetical protein